MNLLRSLLAVPILTVSLLAFSVLGAAAAAQANDAAGDDVPDGDLQAAVRSLGFLDNLPHDGRVAVGIIYPAGLSSGKARAEDVAMRLGAMPGPNTSTLSPTIIASDALTTFPGRLDAVFLIPGTSRRSRDIQHSIETRRLVSISDDPACLDANCCVLMVHAGQRVEIVLDTRLAEATGSRFSAVFTMMVKRK